MTSTTEKLENFLARESNFIMKLRFLDGFDNENANEFLSILDEIGRQISGEDFIEKRLAFLLVEIEPILMSISSQYEGAELEEVLACIDKVNAKISAILE